MEIEAVDTSESETVASSQMSERKHQYYNNLGPRGKSNILSSQTDYEVTIEKREV